MFSKKSFCIITGASKGYGSTLSEKLSERLAKGSVILLTARSKSLLENVKAKLSAKHPDLHFFHWEYDMAKASYKNFVGYFNNFFKDLEPSGFEQCILVHNACLIKDLCQWQLHMTDENEINENWSMNLTSMMLLNSVLLPLFSCKDRFILNISSLCSTTPFNGFSLYCSEKAAREMLLNCLVKENPDIRVLHWCPGPMKTDMVEGLHTKSIDPSIRTAMTDENKLTCDQSADKLMTILEKNSFENPAKIDYYDV